MVKVYQLGEHFSSCHKVELRNPEVLTLKKEHFSSLSNSGCKWIVKTSCGGVAYIHMNWDGDLVKRKLAQLRVFYMEFCM